MNFTLTFTGLFIDSRCVTASMIRHAKHCVTPWNNGCGRWLPAEACSVRCSTFQTSCRLSSFIVAKHISARHHNPVHSWVAIIMITFCFWFKVIMITFCLQLPVISVFLFFFLIISLNLELSLYMMTKGMNDLTHTPLLCIPKVHRSLELLSIYFALSNFTFFYSKCRCLHTTSSQSHLHVPYVFTYIQYINACLYFYIGKCMQHNMYTLHKKTFRHKR